MPGSCSVGHPTQGLVQLYKNSRDLVGLFILCLFTYAMAHGAVRGQLEEVGSLLTLVDPEESNSACEAQAGQAPLLPAPFKIFFFFLMCVRDICWGWSSRRGSGQPLNVVVGI